MSEQFAFQANLFRSLGRSPGRERSPTPDAPSRGLRLMMSMPHRVLRLSHLDIAVVCSGLRRRLPTSAST